MDAIGQGFDSELIGSGSAAAGVSGEGASVVPSAVSVGSVKVAIDLSGEMTIPNAVSEAVAATPAGSAVISLSGTFQRAGTPPAELGDQVLQFIRGDSAWLVFDLADQDGTAIDLSRWEGMRFQLSRFRRQPVVSKSLPEGIHIANEKGGRLVVELAAADTKDLSPGDYYFELQLTDNIAGVATVARGRLALQRDRIR
ncbi:hypothetical protein [Parvibaculum sp. MBR-TMA-1.3b-4.2]|jgi:hypothetical protein